MTSWGVGARTPAASPCVTQCRPRPLALGQTSTQTQINIKLIPKIVRATLYFISSTKYSIIFFKKYCIYHKTLRVRYLLKLVNNVISLSRPISGVINIGYERSSLYFYLLCYRQNYVTGNVLIMHL